MLDIAKYDEYDWDWWYDTVKFWSTSILIQKSIRMEYCSVS